MIRSRSGLAATASSGASHPFHVSPTRGDPRRASDGLRKCVDNGDEVFDPLIGPDDAEKEEVEFVLIGRRKESPLEFVGSAAVPTSTPSGASAWWSYGR